MFGEVNGEVPGKPILELGSFAEYVCVSESSVALKPHNLNRSLSECRRVLNPKGVYLSSFGSPENRWLGPLTRLLAMVAFAPFVSQKMIALTVKRTKEVLLDLKELIEAGKVTPVIDRTYPLCEAAEAMRYLEEGHARGKVVITV